MLPSESIRLRVVEPPSPHEGDPLSDARRGDVRAWNQIYRAHNEAVFRHLSYLVRDCAVAEDLTQETFAIAMARIGGYDGRAALVSWLRGIALNLARRHFRSSSRFARSKARMSELPRPSEPTPDERTTQHRRAEALRDALEQLPPQLREAFVCVDVEGMDASTAAGVLGIRAGNVRVRATRARQRIRGLLAERGWIEEGGP